jgi:hypothetical protein
MSLDLSCGNKQHSHAQRGHDCYETPTVAVSALRRVEALPHTIWEPAAGRRAIVRELRNAGHQVIASDIRAYTGFTLDFTADFLAMAEAPPGIKLILSNPPYKDAGKFVEHALNLCPRATMLCRLGFLESVRRAPILDSGALARVHVFRSRLPMMHRDGWTGARASSAIPFAWFCWDRDHTGPTTIDRISWEGR